MKTADLIPFILLELNDCDKYGFELTKNIETKSGGQIVIKQPTLYTLLKKLEKSKFIASYWQDSDIGGKRHYYKLTENGRLQISTLPSYSDLLKNVLSEEVELDESLLQTVPSTSAEAVATPHTSIMDELLSAPSLTPKETILPSSEVFADSNLDNTTDIDINKSNTSILKNDNISAEEQFAENTDISKFTEKEPISLPNPITTDKPANVILKSEFVSPRNDLDIKYVDYVDFKNSKEAKYAKKITSRKLLQVLATSASIIVLAAICELITMFVGHSPLYYACFIMSILVAVFYPALYLSKMEKFRLKCQSSTYLIKTKQRMYLGLTVLLVLLITCVIVSVGVGENTIAKMLSVSNFANLYAPLLLFSTYFLDLLFNHLILSKIK